MFSGNILQYGQQTRPVLTADTGKLFAVFSSSVYLEANNQICCLGTSTLVRGPINIGTDLTKIEGLNVGESWEHKNGTLTLGSRYTLTATRAVEWNHNSRSCMDMASNETIKTLSYCCSTIDSYLSRSFDRAALGNTTERLVHERMKNSLLLLSEYLIPIATPEPVNEIPEALVQLIGCGDGLTPAGDDILVGVLVALYHFNDDAGRVLLAEWVLDNAPGRTNRISLAHLAAACTGQAIEPIHQLLDIISATDTGHKKLRLSATIKELINYGHSSGQHALSGINLVLKTLLVRHQADNLVSPNS